MRLFRTVALCLVSLVAGFSQVPTTGRMDGTVTDPQGAVITGAEVTVTQPATSQTFHVTTDEKGYWALPSLGTGTYRVTVTHAGFKAASNANIVIDAGVPATVNIALEVGATTDTVEVTAGA